MVAATPTSWTPGADLPYAEPLGDGRSIAVLIPAAWLKADHSGEPLFLPPAVRFLDRLRAVFTNQERITPGLILNLREALNLGRQEFGSRLGVSESTVEQWEHGTSRPDDTMIRAIRDVQLQARRRGVEVDGDVHRR